ncbi:MAG: hypothetical protein DI582_06450 [Azospirillum brasilense]|nr:MAG: hypothetical protein DI582_06450 [Azospirillum brasilense]
MTTEKQNPPLFSTAKQMLHDTRRAEVRGRYFSALEQDKSLLLHRASAAELPQWAEVCQTIFNAAYDFHDANAINPSRDAVHIAHKQAIHTMTDHQLCHTVPEALAQLTALASHAIHATQEVHAGDKERAAMKQANQSFAAKVQAGRAKKAQGKPQVSHAVRAIEEDAELALRGHQADEAHFAPLAKIMNQKMGSVWNHHRASDKLNAALVPSVYSPYDVRVALHETLSARASKPVPEIFWQLDTKPHAVAATMKYLGDHNVTDVAVNVWLLERFEEFGFHAAKQCVTQGGLRDHAPSRQEQGAAMGQFTQAIHSKMEALEQLGREGMQSGRELGRLHSDLRAAEACMKGAFKHYLERSAGRSGGRGV